MTKVFDDRGLNQEVPRQQTGIEGFDDVTNGGVPEGRMTLVTGTAGSGKTVLAAQFLAAGAAGGDPGVFVTFEERPASIRRNVTSFGWDIEAWEQQGHWCFVDASPDFSSDLELGDGYDLAPLVARVEHSVRASGARRVAMDSIGALIAQFPTPGPARKALFQIARVLEELNVTTIMTGERAEDYGAVAHFGFEEFVADCVLVLRNALTGEKRRRTIEVLKLRGGSHAKGEHLFTLRPDRGIIVLPNSALDFNYRSSTERVTSGNAELDGMLRGGFFERSLVLVSGATGTGKSLLCTQHVAGGVQAGQRALLYSFEESRDQIVRNAAQWGYDFASMESQGSLRIVAQAPEAYSLEDHLLRMKSEIDQFGPDRVAIDSLTALQRVATVQSFREYMLGLAFHIKTNALLGLVTATALSQDGDQSLTDLHVSTITDTIVVLQYVALDGEMRRGVTVLKMRGSDHDKALREFYIDDQGFHLIGSFGGVRGMLTPTSAERSSNGSDPA